LRLYGTPLSGATLSGAKSEEHFGRSDVSGYDTSLIGART